MPPIWYLLAESTVWTLCLASAVAVAAPASVAQQASIRFRSVDDAGQMIPEIALGQLWPVQTSLAESVWHS